MNTPTSTIGAIATVVDDALQIAQTRGALENTAEQRSNEEAKQIQADRERARQEIANPDQTALNADTAP